MLFTVKDGSGTSFTAAYVIEAHRKFLKDMAKLLHGDVCTEISDALSPNGLCAQAATAKTPEAFAQHYAKLAAFTAHFYPETKRLLPDYSRTAQFLEDIGVFDEVKVALPTPGQPTIHVGLNPPEQRPAPGA